MNNKNKTRNQHYVPKVYLRNFSTDISKNTIYSCPIKKVNEYNIINISNRPQNIKNICSKDNLYEGEGIPENAIERDFSILENQYNNYFTRLNYRIKNNYNNINAIILDIEDKNYWRKYVLSQYVRIPDIAENFDNNKRDVFYAIYKWIQGVPINIFYSKNDVFITSDNPVCCCFTIENKNIIFPVSPNIVLCFGEVLCKNRCSNRIINITFDNEVISFINKAIIESAKKYLLSSKCFSDKDIALIKEIKIQ